MIMGEFIELYLSKNDFYAQGWERSLVGKDPTTSGGPKKTC